MTARVRFVLLAGVALVLAWPLLLFFLGRLVLSNDALLLDHVAERRTPLVELAIWAAADPNYRDDNGRSALPAAVDLGDSEIVQILLNAGADSNALTSNGEPVAVAAVQRGETEILQMLLDAGADPNADAGAGIAVLVWAVVQGDAEMPRMLLEAGADPNTLAAEGVSVLAKAVELGDIEVVRLLLGRRRRPQRPRVVLVSRSSPRDPATPTCSSYSRPGRSPRKRC